MKGRITLRTKAQNNNTWVDSIQFYANRTRFRRSFEDDYRHRYSFDDVIDDTVSYYNLIGLPYGLRRIISIDNRRMMRRFKYNNDTRTVRDLAW